LLGRARDCEKDVKNEVGEEIPYCIKPTPRFGFIGEK
jgi:hypothetical protein